MKELIAGLPASLRGDNDASLTAQTMAETSTRMKLSFMERFGLLVILAVLVGAGGLIGYEKVHEAQVKQSLLAAIEKGDADEVKLLLAEGVDPNAFSDRLLEKPCVSTMLRSTLPDAARQRGEHKTTALMMAVMSRHGYLVALLLDRGARVNEADEYGFTALSLAVSVGRLDIVEQLLEHGADPNVTNEAHTPPLNWAILLREAAIARALLEKGADPNGQDNSGMPALYLACMDGDTTLLHLLLDRGAKPNVAYKGWSALRLAVADDNPDLTRLLLAKGADSHETLEDGRTLLEVAIAEKKNRVLPILKQSLPKQTAGR